MYAIIETGGKQYRVTEGVNLKVEKLEATGEVVFDRVLMVSDGEKATFGTPYLDNVKVIADVLETKKARKVLVFKKKPRKGFKRLRGHRQLYTTVRIKNIQVSG
jgi:large subunit ribosomal protein L21